MSAEVAYLNGAWVGNDQLTVSAYDAGFIQGLTVAEQLRTFRGRLFRLPDHLRRLCRSLEIVGVAPGLSIDRLGEIAEEVVARNYPQLPAGSDLGVAIWVTPGPYAKFAHVAPPGPAVCCHAHALDFHAWAHLYQQGQRLVTASYRQVSPLNWPAELKCRSRMHYHLADREARLQDPQARALLLDLEGYVCEASTANLLAYWSQEGLVVPRPEKILPGISMSVLRSLAAQLDIPFVQRNMTPEEFRRADEILLCSTSPCVQPVTRVDGAPIGAGKPGPVFARLLHAWSERVGCDIAAQATAAASQGPPAPM